MRGMSRHTLQEPQAAEGKTNPMKDLFLEKLILNICVGESGDRLTRAAKVGLRSTLHAKFERRETGARVADRPDARVLQGPLHHPLVRHPP